MSKRTLQMVAKVGFLLIIIGFFQPIACNLNGFELIQVLRSTGETGSVAHLAARLLMGLLGISIVGFLLLIMRVNILALDWFLFISSLAAGLTSYLIMRGQERWEQYFLRLILGRGVTFIIIGWVFTGFFLLIASLLPSVQKTNEAVKLTEHLPEE